MEMPKNNHKRKFFSRFFPRQGSILVFTLFILLIMLVVSLSVASVTVKDLQSTNTTAKTVQSFQVADSAIEVITKNMIDNNYASLSDLASNLSTPGSPWECVAGKLSGSISQLGSVNAIEITFKDQASEKIESCASNAPASMKVVATHEGTTRAIETVVAAGNEPIVCKKTMDPYGPAGANNYTIRFTAAECGGAFPPANYVGVLRRLQVGGGTTTARVFDRDELSPGDRPGMTFWANGPDGGEAHFEAVYFKTN